MEKSTQPTRTCSVCGLQKPLAAFLQMIIGLGTHYGNICSTCRSTQAKTKPEIIDEEWSKAGTGARIGTKEKAFIDEQKAREKAAKLAAEHKEKNKIAFGKSEKEIREETKLKAEKDHRNFFLEIKTPSITGEKPQSAKSFTDRIETSPESIADVKVVHDYLIREQKFRTGEIGYAPLSLNEMKYHTAMFQHFVEAFLTEASPLKRFLNLHSKRPSAFGSKPSAEASPRSILNAVEDLIEKKLGPSSRK